MVARRWAKSGTGVDVDFIEYIPSTKEWPRARELLGRRGRVAGAGGDGGVGVSCKRRIALRLSALRAMSLKKAGRVHCRLALHHCGSAKKVVQCQEALHPTACW